MICFQGSIDLLLVAVQHSPQNLSNHVDFLLALYPAWGLVHLTQSPRTLILEAKGFVKALSIPACRNSLVSFWVYFFSLSSLLWVWFFLPLLFLSFTPRRKPVSPLLKICPWNFHLFKLARDRCYCLQPKNLNRHIKKRNYPYFWTLLKWKSNGSSL